MTQIDRAPAPAKEAAPKPARKRIHYMWMLLVLVLLLSASSTLLVRSASHAVTIVPVTSGDDALEKRVEVLEARVAALAEAPAPTAQTVPIANDNGALGGTVKNLEEQITQLQNQGKDSQQAARKLIAAGFAFWDLRETAKTDRPFAAQLDIVRTASGDNPAIAEQIAKLEPFATVPPPTLPQLAAQLTAQEATLAAPSPEQGASWWVRLVALLRPLISVHPLHDPRFEALEKALDSGDVEKALDIFKTLPDDAQQKLAGWQTQLAARRTIDEALQAIDASLTNPAPGNAP